MSVRFRALALTAFGLLTLTMACSAESGEEEADETDDALSATECTKIVERDVATSISACRNKETAIQAKQKEIDALKGAIAPALGGFVTELASYAGSGAAQIARVVAECGGVKCKGELQQNGVKADCDTERFLLQSACYVSNWGVITAAATNIDFSDEYERLQNAANALATNWGPLAIQRDWLKAQHGVCSTYAGSPAQRSKLYATCRSSCDENAATSVGNAVKDVGHHAPCSPAGFEEVKDDLGNVVKCGQYKRPWYTAGTICECAVGDECTQFNAVGTSSERGKACGDGKFKKLVWNAQKQLASLECR
jgi:hypothetical protein